ncbi:Deoxynucleoside triphosphate triphosphohydrolase SAMHD1 [Symbiodinium microadriaticum]|uniref:Deoxynucleoside triphosphate triphosphohydrolase SAMHD1 n=1 Tax=Symbiodinium microadriaticum TaxID=2951 RepID=A0A1Q9DMR7_SYMMI|nr:Deoxynucleoside triphosphate triphosphohydrolase SAMHD1 [Symbiodinium microadriaticum]
MVSGATRGNDGREGLDPKRRRCLLEDPDVQALLREEGQKRDALPPLLQETFYVNDPIHGLICLPGVVKLFVDSMEFQRMRFIKQLGICEWVFPGATHNRFFHSIGTAYLSWEMIRGLQSRQPELQITNRDLTCVTLAGLCHDLGHPCFSHMFEVFMHQLGHDKWSHEQASVVLVKELLRRFWPRLSAELGLGSDAEGDDQQLIQELIDPPKAEMEKLKEGKRLKEEWGSVLKGRTADKAWIYEIVSNWRTGIDVDKFDYFRPRGGQHASYVSTQGYTAVLLGGLACVLAEEDGQDGSCMLQAQAHGKDKVAMVEAKQMKAELKHALHQKTWNKGFCKGEPLTEYNFNSFSHGTEIKPDSIKGMTITATRRATQPEPGFGKPCPGPLLVLDTREEFRSVDKDLQRCKECTIAVWSKDGNRRKVNDCGEHPGVLITITFKKLQSLDELELWDLEEPTFVELIGTKNRLLKNISAPDGPGQDGNPAILKLLTTHVRTMKIYLGGSGGIRRFTACRGGSVWGDPHIYTLDGEKFDLYESGTYTVFQYSGQKLQLPQVKGHNKGAKGGKHGMVDWKLYSHYGGPLWTAQGLLLLDHSMGRFRQALELSSKDCQWRSKTGEKGHWEVVKSHGHSLSLLEDEEYVTSFEYVTEKKIMLRMNGERGKKDTMVLNTVCKPSGINMRVSMPNMVDSQFLEGQIQVGNGGKHKKKFQTNQGWVKLGGTAEAQDFLDHLETKQTFLEGEGHQARSCDEAERSKAEKLCQKHLGGEMREADGINAQIFEDCVSDVCQGGEEFAKSAAELLAATA